MAQDSATDDNDGIVIEDEDGNRFVWVPCNGSDRVTYEKENGLAVTWREKYSDKQTSYIEYTDWTDDGGDSNSVSKYGGFYVARYEAGIPSNADFYAENDGDTYYTDERKNVVTYIPVSKANTPSWNYISQENAKTVSTNMYQNSSSVTSSLIDSYAWDTIVEWMGKNKPGIALDTTNYGNYTDSNIAVDNENAIYALHRYNEAKKDSGKNTLWTLASTYKKGNLTTGMILLTDTSIRDNYEFKDYDDTNYIYTIRKELATGATDATKVNNIYDMAGNMWEWTTEIGYRGGQTTTEQAVLRGGYFRNNGDTYPLSSRYGGDYANYCDVGFGFRVVLYIK